MTLAALIRFFLLETLVLGLMFMGFVELMEEVRKKGFHWFKTPLMACWIMIGYLSVFYLALYKLRDLDNKS